MLNTFYRGGRAFHVNAAGQKVDEDGFFTSSSTKNNPPWFCVSVRIKDKIVQVRDTKDPNKTTLTFNEQEWIAFLDGVKSGEFDI